ncbi:MAG: hypothetical protein C6W57_16355 [Caldibacillus debilis]|nr:MAG: hypothetical protein C6W57_16355 [Caldibacillus debilis]
MEPPIKMRTGTERIRFRCVSAFLAVGNPYHTEAKLQRPGIGEIENFRRTIPCKNGNVLIEYVTDGISCHWRGNDPMTNSFVRPLPASERCRERRNFRKKVRAPRGAHAPKTKKRE